MYSKRNSNPEIDSDIVADLRKSNEEYADIQGQIFDLNPEALKLYAPSYRINTICIFALFSAHNLL